MAAISVSKRTCRATAAPVMMEMSRRFMGRLSLTLGVGQKRGSQVLRRRDVVLWRQGLTSAAGKPRSVPRVAIMLAG